MQKFIVAALAVVSSLSAAAHADIIAGRAGGTVVSVQGNNPEAASWTESATYTDVTISAFLSSTFFSNDGTGTVYLTNSIGSGTTVANQIAQTSISGLGYTPSSALTLFSGLTLGPGTYYIVTDAGPGGLGWENFSGNANIAGIAGTNNQDLISSVDASYPPASDFSNDGTAFDFEVSGSSATAVTPEPSSLALLGTGILGLAGVARRRLSPR